MPKIKLLKNVPTNKLLQMVPPTLRILVDIDSITEEIVNLALFSVDNRYVATSGDVKKIIDDISELTPIVVVGGSFTSEAAGIMKKIAYYFVCRDDGF